MTLILERTIDCPSCATQQQVSVCESVNVTLDRELKSRILSGELFRFQCSRCGYNAELIAALLYHDMRGLMIYLVPDAASFELPEIGSGTDMDFYTFRVVATANELREKILAYDAGLDDRVLEMLKAAIEENITGPIATDSGAVEPIPELSFTAGEREQPVAFTMADAKRYTGPMRATIPWERYATLAAMLEARAEDIPHPTASGRWLRVDRDYGRRALDALV